MDLRQIKNLMKEFEESTIHKLEIKDKEFSISLEKENQNVFSSSPILQTAQQPLPIQEVAVPVKEEKVENDNIKVKAPLVGTFYASPSPDSDPFVQVGKSVQKGEVLFIIEAMKVMNEITSPDSGTVVKINSQDGNMVEFGEVLLEIAK
jgi:acetyl-CoA carboxylase biotin carboxyl carrier protein